MQIGISEIQKILPQSYPFILIDRILEFQTKEKIISLKNITANENYLVGHFPSRPIMPGVLIIEAMAQTAIVFFAKSYPEQAKEKFLYYLGKVDAKFLAPVFCGDQLKIELKPLRIISNMGLVYAEAFVGEKVVAKAQLGFSAK